jgi:O-antigen ligase
MAQITLSADRTAGRALAAADWVLPALLLAIPVSTTAAEILYWLWLVLALVAIGPERIRFELRSPAASIPVAIFILGLLGLAWTIAPWKDAFKHLGIFSQFIVIPVLFAQMRIHPNAARPLVAVLAVAAVIWIWSVLSLIWPHGVPVPNEPGIPLKNYSVQSILFSLLAFGLAHWSVASWRAGAGRTALLCGGGALLLLGNVIFVASSRTVLIGLVPLLILFFVQLTGWRGFIIGAVIAAVVCAVAWFSSSHVRERVMSIPHEIERSIDSGEVTSAGERLVYWQKALHFVAERPLFGHGTGSAPELYRRAASGTGMNAETPGDPHNQVLAFAIPLGIVGVALLVALLIAHACLFWGPGPIRFTGQSIVLLYTVTGLFNSHLMTFTESKIYLFSVGILGGLLLSGIMDSPRQNAN